MWTLWHSWHIGNTEPFMHYVTRNHPIVGGGTWFVGQKRARLWCGVGKLPLPAKRWWWQRLYFYTDPDHWTIWRCWTWLSWLSPATKYLYNQTRDASLRLRRFHSIWARAINRVLDIFAVTTVWFVSSHWVLGWRRLDPSKMWGHHHQSRGGGFHSDKEDQYFTVRHPRNLPTVEGSTAL